MTRGPQCPLPVTGVSPGLGPVLMRPSPERVRFSGGLARGGRVAAPGDALRAARLRADRPGR